MFMPLFWQNNVLFFLKVFWCPQALVEIKDRSHVVVMCLFSVLSCDLCSVGWLIGALMESVWKRNNKCRAVSFRSDVPPQINGLEIHTKCRESPVGAGMCSAEGSPVIFVNTTEVTSAVWAQCSRSKWNPLHCFYEFRKGETIEILSHKLGGGRGGWGGV